MNASPITFAQIPGDWTEVLFWIAVALFWAVGAAAKWWQENQEKKNTETPTQPAGESKKSGEPGSLRRRLTELAEERRRQLREMTRDREQGERSESPPPPLVATRPEADRNAPKREESKSRAEALRRAAERRAREAERAATRERRRRGKPRRRRTPRQAEEVQADRLPPTPRPTPSRRIAQPEAVRPAPPAAVIAIVPVTRPRLSAARLREVIILKELLDKPVGLRDSGAGGISDLP